MVGSINIARAIFENVHILANVVGYYSFKCFLIVNKGIYRYSTFINSEVKLSLNSLVNCMLIYFAHFFIEVFSFSLIHVLELFIY